MRRLVILITLFIGLSAAPCRAQSTSDLVQQLVLDFQKLQDMKAILQQMYKGYQILDKGYSEIRDLARGRFDLHKVFLDGLLSVSPAVRDYYRIQSILDAEFQLLKAFRAAADHMDGMYSTLFNRSLQCIDELTMVITDGQLRMNDAQRIRSIDRVYAEISGQLSAIRQLNNEHALQDLQRQKEKNNIHFLKRLYDNP